MASGGTDVSRIDTSPPQEAHVLYGAIVGGPDRNDKFGDIRSNWTQTEVSNFSFLSFTIFLTMTKLRR